MEASKVRPLLLEAPELYERDAIRLKGSDTGATTATPIAPRAKTKALSFLFRFHAGETRQRDSCLVRRLFSLDVLRDKLAV